MQLNLDDHKIKLVREIVNDTPLFYESSNLKPHWNIICSFMDRIEDSVKELNDLKFRSDITMSSNGIILLFVYADIIKSCIKILIEEFGFTEINHLKSDIFQQLGFDDKGNDDDFFYHLRNLSFAHVLKVDRKSHYLLSNGVKERLCSPIISDTGEMISIIVYSNLRSISESSLVVSKSSIFEYIQRKYNELDEIILGLNEIIKSYESDWSEQKVDASTDIIVMLNQLKDFYRLRFDRFTYNFIEKVITLLEYEPQIKQNIPHVKNLQRYVSLLTIDYIECFNKRSPSTQNHEFFNIFSVSPEVGIQNSHYILEKIQVYLTQEQSGENNYNYVPNSAAMPHYSKVYLGFAMLEKFKKDFADKYVTINYNMTFSEIQILVLTSLYMYHRKI